MYPTHTSDPQSWGQVVPTEPGYPTLDLLDMVVIVMLDFCANIGQFCLSGDSPCPDWLNPYMDLRFRGLRGSSLRPNTPSSLSY